MPNKRLPSVLSRIFNWKNTPAEGNFSRAADAARDAKRWSEAAANYTAYLSLVPDDQKIYVQLGNCLKEAGKQEQALKAYDTAIQLDERDADVFLQRGHLLKVMGRLHDAAHSYSKSFERNQQDNPAFEELLLLKKNDSLDAPTSRQMDTVAEAATLMPLETDVAHQLDGPIIYLDITDLIDYLRCNNSLSGIQRVCSNIILNSTRFTESHPGTSVVPVLPDYTGSKIYSVRISLLDGLLGMVAKGQSGRDELNRAIDLILESRSSVLPEAGDTLVIPGAFWIYHHYDLLNALRQKGVRVAVFVHDLIQITDPEYVEPKATTIFRRGFVDILLVSNYILTNSHFVADEVRRYMSEHMNFEIPVKAITLATELGTKKSDLRGVQQQYIELAKEEYVLCVGTIEIRKNHMYLIKTWERMIAEDRFPVPNLVLIGKWGWEIDDLHKHLADSDYLGGRLFIFNGISDMDLAYFYEHCLFTIYPSFAEGWGLPVGESLGYGKPCIASGVTAIPEVGGNLCRYIDPFDLEDGLRTITDTLADRANLAAWTQRVREEFSVKTWHSFAFEFLQAVADFARDPKMNLAGNNFVMETSAVNYIGHDMLMDYGTEPRRIANARMARMTGWHGLEGWGCWSMRRRATLRFKTRLQPGEGATLYLFLKTADGDEIANCTIKSGATATPIEDLRPTPRWITVPVEVGENGIIDVLLISGKGYYHRHGREIYVGIIAVAITPSDDYEARLKLLDEIVPNCLLPRETRASAEILTMPKQRELRQRL